MPKMKTNRSAAKRFKKTGTGKIKRSKAYKNHFNRRLSSKQVRNLRKGAIVSKGDEKRINKLLPY